MLIRASVDSDLQQVIEFDHIARRPDQKRQRFLAERVAAHQMLVAERDSEIVGYVIQDAGFFEHGFVHLLAVSERHRRQGIGASLLAASVRECATSRVFTSTNLSNGEMQRLLRREGWIPSGLIHGLDEGDPEVFYYIDSH